MPGGSLVRRGHALLSCDLCSAPYFKMWFYMHGILPVSSGFVLGCALPPLGLYREAVGSYLRLIDSCITQLLRLKDLLGPVTRAHKKQTKGLCRGAALSGEDTPSSLAPLLTSTCGCICTGFLHVSSGLGCFVPPLGLYRGAVLPRRARI